MSLYFIIGIDGECTRIVEATSEVSAIELVAQTIGVPASELTSPDPDIGDSSGSMSAELANRPLDLGPIEGGSQVAVFKDGRLLRVEDCDDHSEKTADILARRLWTYGLKATFGPFAYLTVDDIPRYRAVVESVVAAEPGPPLPLLYT